MAALTTLVDTLPNIMRRISPKPLEPTAMRVDSPSFPATSKMASAGSSDVLIVIRGRCPSMPSSPAARSSSSASARRAASSAPREAPSPRALRRPRNAPGRPAPARRRIRRAPDARGQLPGLLGVRGRVVPDDHPCRWPGTLSAAHHQDWTTRVVDDTLRDASQEDPFYLAASPAPQDQQAGPEVLAQVEDFVDGPSLPEVGLRYGRSGMLEAHHLPLEHLLGFPLELRPHEGSEVRGWYVLPDVHHVQLGAALSREVGRRPCRKGRVLRAVGGQEDPARETAQPATLCRVRPSTMTFFPTAMLEHNGRRGDEPLQPRATDPDARKVGRLSLQPFGSPASERALETAGAASPPVGGGLPQHLQALPGGQVEACPRSCSRGLSTKDIGQMAPRTDPV